jgi:hypothetical protein
MPKQEAGHAKNMSNFDQLLTTIVGYVPVYNPDSASHIQLSALQALQPQVRSSMAAVNQYEGLEHATKSARRAAFKPLSKLITSIVNAQQILHVGVQIDENVKTLVRKFRGGHSKTKTSRARAAAATATTGTGTTATTTTPIVTVNTNSTSQKGFDTMLDSFDKLIQLLKAIPQYNPNDTRITTAALTTLYNDLTAKNAAVVSASVNLSNAQNVRYTVCYVSETGMVYRAKDVKKYVKSFYGTASHEYKQISKLVFKPYPL